MPTVHYILGPSKSPQYTRCAGSVLYIKQLIEAGQIAEDQEEKVTSPSRVGTRAHQLLEHCLTPGAEIRPHLVAKLKDEFGEWVPDIEMIGYIQEVIDYIGKRQIELMPSVCHSEREVNPQFFTECPEMGGTLDIQILSKHKGVLEIADLKYGQGIKVNPEDNTQLILYAAGAMAELDDWQELNEVVLTIMQPRIPSSRGTVRSVTHTPHEIVTKAKEIGDHGQLALSGFAPRTPGDIQCRWCAGRNLCEERQQWALTASSALFGDTTAMTPEAMEEQFVDAANTEPSTLTDEKLATILDGIPGLKAYIRDMEAEGQRRLEHGRSIPGYKLVTGRNSRVWKLDEEHLRLALKDLRIKVSAFSKTTILGVSALRKIVPETKREEFDSLWETKGGKPIVVHETDERLALDLSAVTFGPVKAD